MFFFYDYVIRIYILVLNLTEYLLRNVLYVGLLQNSNMFLCKIKIQPNTRVLIVSTHKMRQLKPVLTILP